MQIAMANRLAPSVVAAEAPETIATMWLEMKRQHEELERQRSEMKSRRKK